jgi:hypothetical protein
MLRGNWFEKSGRSPNHFPVGPDRVRTGPRDDELEELVDQLVADPIDAFTVGTDVTLE